MEALGRLDRSNFIRTYFPDLIGTNLCTLHLATSQPLKLSPATASINFGGNCTRVPLLGLKSKVTRRFVVGPRLVSLFFAIYKTLPFVHVKIVEGGRFG